MRKLTLVVPLLVLIACQEEPLRVLAPETPQWAASAAKEYVEIPLGDLGGGSTIAYAINARGHVAGTGRNLEGFSRAFLWTAREGMQDLGAPIDGSDWYWTEAYDINDGGTIAGAAFAGGHDWSWMGPNPFTWSSQHGMTILPCGNEGFGLSVNNAGTVVGFGELGPYIGYSVYAGWRYEDGVCRILKDDDFVAPAAWYVNNEGEIEGLGVRYIMAENNLDFVPIDNRTYVGVWSPTHGFIVGAELVDSRSRNPRGDYVSGGSLFTQTPRAYGHIANQPAGPAFEPHRAASYGGVSEALVAIGCPPLLELVKATDPMLLDRCLGRIRGEASR
jgi:probable HAF family extracellular repeat protein